MHDPTQRQVRAFAFEGPYCYGVACDRHAECLRYVAHDKSTDDRPVIGNCGPERPLHVPREGLTT